MARQTLRGRPPIPGTRNWRRATDAADAQSYLESEKNLRQARTQEAQEFLALGNSSLEKGDPQQARRAFQAAFGLSTDDAAFNEDARVQLHNIKLQQALIGLNARQSGAAGDTGRAGRKTARLAQPAGTRITRSRTQKISLTSTAPTTTPPLCAWPRN